VVIDEGITDPVAFFSALPHLLPEATHLEVQGSGIVSPIRAFYRAHRDGNRPRWPRQGLSLSRNDRFRCAVSPLFFGELARLATGRAHREITDHLAVFLHERVLLEWHDAFANALLLAPDLPEDRVREMARRLGVGYSRV